MKRLLVFLVAAAVIIPVAGTCFGATGTAIQLQNESGVSFAVAPVLSGMGSGNTLYVMSGGQNWADMDPNNLAFAAAGPAWTGVTMWQVNAASGHAEWMWADPYDNPGTAAFTGLNRSKGTYAAGVGSLTMIPNADHPGAGVSIFAITNNFDYTGDLWAVGNANYGRAVTGFSVWGLSHDSDNTLTESLVVHDAGVSDVVVYHPPAYTNNHMQNSNTVSGNSLYFATTGTRPYDAMTVSLAGSGAKATGSTIYCLNPGAVGVVSTDTANDVLQARFESYVSQFITAPVIKEGTSGVSIFILGSLAPGRGPAGFSGVSLFGYRGTDINTGATPAWQYRIANVTTNRVPFANGQRRTNFATGITAWPTPCLGKGAINWGNNNYSGSSLFVVDGVGGVSVFNVNCAVPPVSTGANATFVNFYKYSDDETTLSGATPHGAPVCNGRYVVIPSATGVSCYQSAAAALTDDATGANTAAFAWGYEFGAGQGIAGTWVPTVNWYTSGSPVLSDGVVVVSLTSDTGTVGEFRANGKILVLRLLDGTLIDSYDMTTGAIASPIVSGHNVWAVDYNSSIQKISTTVEGQAFWHQFKFDAAKTGENSEEENDQEYYDDDNGCFIRTVR